MQMLEKFSTVSWMSDYTWKYCKNLTLAEEIFHKKEKKNENSNYYRPLPLKGSFNDHS